MQRSPIEWTDFTANPLKYLTPEGHIVHACIHKSGGCLHCYAEVLAKRWGRDGKPFTAENMKRLTPYLDKHELDHMRGYKPAAGKRCFIGDMTDIFGEWVPDDLLNPLFSNTLEMRENVQWQILTKRADRMHKYLSWRWGEGRIPMRNIWVGVSVEDQKTADERIPLLLQTPAAVRFVSYEPALGSVDFNGYIPEGTARDQFKGPFLNWIIVGGESGPGARPFNLQWARDTIAQCRASVPVFVKQLGAKPVRPFESGVDPEGLLIDGEDESKAILEMVLTDRKGGSMEEWPEDLRVREFLIVK